ncbi:MAG: DNA repair protein RadA [Candidatus Hydrogenedentes bacterium CG1_02_42_14]|nr:MAG: DNA repair protein RadA [Candidatus Hydrogenedentes bacterium CG1_02_42_14]
MNKSKSYACSECGASQPQWLGRCPSCGAWGSIAKEETSGRGKRSVRLDQVEPEEAGRIRTGISELDRVFGGGLVKGSINLLAGDPGIGKSTLALQMSSAFDSVLYAAGEESPSQIRLRADRLGIDSKRIKVTTETLVEKIVAEAKELMPSLLVIDSIQTARVETSNSVGAVNQIREAAAYLLHSLKEPRIPAILVGHVTKSGDIAGPMLLEHLVDVVLLLESDTSGAYRLLRGLKNRFGSVDEVGLFAMGEDGMREITNPSELLLPTRTDLVPGSAVVASLEGRRPLLIELQALTVPTAFGTPRRLSTGIEQNRLSMLLAVLERRGGIQVGNSDVYLNSAGGFRLKEPAVDLGVEMAVASAVLDLPVPEHAIFIGEVGLGGEIRPVGKIESRLKEAAKLGFKSAFIPEQKIDSVSEISLRKVKHISEALCIFQK